MLSMSRAMPSYLDRATDGGTPGERGHSRGADSGDLPAVMQHARGD
jgi:hypothetical protein